MAQWLTGWSYRKSHEIEGSTAGAQTNYQVKIIVHKGAGTDSGEHVYCNNHCRDDFGDIRFTDSDGVTELDYWLESYTSGDQATFWVEVPSIPASPDTATIYIYYDKPDATTTSDGEATFPLFDHFEGTSLDTNKWTTYGSGTYSVSNSILDVVDGATTLFVYSIATFNYPIAWRAKIRIDNPRPGASGYGKAAGFRNTMTIEDDKVAIGWWSAKNTYFTQAQNEGTATITQITQSLLAWSVVDILWTSSKAQFYQNDSLIDEITTNIPDEASSVYFKSIRTDGVHVDWILVRKYVDPEPTHGAWGSEETAPPVLVEKIVAKTFPMLYLPKITVAERNVKLLATLTAEGSPLSGKTIHYYHRVSGATEWTYDGTSVTDSEGKATKILTLDVPQTYDFKAEFQGDETYASSSDQVSDESISTVERVRAQALMSKVQGATIKHVAKDFPQALIKEGKAEELRSKFS